MSIIRFESKQRSNIKEQNIIQIYFKLNFLRIYTYFSAGSELFIQVCEKVKKIEQFLHMKRAGYTHKEADVCK